MLSRLIVNCSPATPAVVIPTPPETNNVSPSLIVCCAPAFPDTIKVDMLPPPPTPVRFEPSPKNDDAEIAADAETVPLTCSIVPSNVRFDSTVASSASL